MKQGYLPGFEDLEDKQKEDKRLKQEILKLMLEMAEHEKEYNSPLKLATWEKNLKTLMLARENLWKPKQNGG